jgi:hypothetical protein
MITTIIILSVLLAISLFFIYKLATLNNELQEKVLGYENDFFRLTANYEKLAENYRETVDSYEQSVELFGEKPYRDINLHAQCQHCWADQVFCLDEDMMFTCEACKKTNSIILEVKTFQVSTPLTSTTGFNTIQE